MCRGESPEPRRGDRVDRRLGTEVLHRIERQPFIIFTTAFSQHAVSAFELGAVDYLLKPFGPARLSAAMERIRSAIGEPAGVGAIERLSGALSSGPISRLFVRKGGALVPLLVEVFGFLFGNPRGTNRTSNVIWSEWPRSWHG